MYSDMEYPDAKHDNALTLGQVYEQIIGYLSFKLYGKRISFYRTKEEQYNIGESVEGIEVKLDNWCTRTRRLSIEIGEKTYKDSKSFVASGILRKDNTKEYIQGNIARAWWFEKNKLRQYYIDNQPSIITEATIKKFYLPISSAELLSTRTLSIIPFVCEYSFHSPLPQWKNCEPCPLYQESRCISEGARLWQLWENANAKRC